MRHRNDWDRDESFEKLRQIFPLWTVVECPEYPGKWEVVGYSVRFDGLAQILVQPEGLTFDEGDQHLGLDPYKARIVDDGLED